MTTNLSSLANLIWSVADLLRGDFKQFQYGRISVLRRLECVLAPTHGMILATTETSKAMPVLTRHKSLSTASEHFIPCDVMRLTSAQVFADEVAA